MAFRWGPMMARLELYMDPPFPSSTKRNVGNVGPPLTNCSGSTHGSTACRVHFLTLYKMGQRA